MAEKFEPIINTNKTKSSLNSKKVAVRGKTDFGRTPSNLPESKITSDPQSKKSSNKASGKDKRFAATLTQKVSPSVNLKMNTLKPFLGELENMPKATINEIVDLVIDSYVTTRLSTRQQEAFKAMYETQLNMLK